MNKTNEYCCPKCGEDIDLETIDTEFDESSVMQKLYCTKCGEVWREYFKTTYDGYSLDGKSYNAEGVEI